MIAPLALLALAPQSTWYVDAAAPAPGDGTLAAPYARIDFALAQATTLTGDTVLVAPGEYTGEVVDFAGKDVVVRSSGGAAVTTIRGSDDPMNPEAAVRLDSGEGAGAVLDGFTIIGGWGALGAPPLDGQQTAGCGVYCDGASATLQNLVFRPGPAAAQAGSGLFVNQGSLSLTDCVFEDLGEDPSFTVGGGIAAYDSVLSLTDVELRRNKAAYRGGGVFLKDCTAQLLRVDFEDNVMAYASGAGLAAEASDVVMVECRFVSNQGNYWGGAVFTEGGALDVRDSVFTGNNSGIDAYPGGAISCSGATDSFHRCTFSSNQGQAGGALCNHAGEAHVEDCFFASNVAWGGQISSRGGAICGATTVRRSVFIGNTAVDLFSDGGGAIYSAGLVENCTFVDNVASAGLTGAVRSAQTMRNCIVRGSGAGAIGAGVPVTYSNVEGGFPGTGNFDEDPRFWGGAADVALLPTSPCIDAGDPSAPLDADGTRADVGALPFDPFACGAGCDGPLGATTCVSNPNSTGVDARLLGFGSDVASANLVVLTVDEVPRNQFGIFFTSRTPGFGPLTGSQGVLCVGGSILRRDQSILTDRGTGTVSDRIDLTDIAQGQAAVAGETWTFQYWFRDLNPQVTSNTSSSLRISFR